MKTINFKGYEPEIVEYGPISGEIIPKLVDGTLNIIYKTVISNYY